MKFQLIRHRLGHGFALVAILMAIQLNPATSHGNSTDPCGMVPPIYTGNDVPISRIGLQQTYVMYKDGVETFVIRPGFTGNVDEFGMLIPFPTPPAIRKVSDNVFPHIKNAIDPPEVVVDLRMRRMRGGFGGGGAAAPANAAMQFQQLSRDEVKVVKEEAVGMYEVAVLQAGSSDALKKWMDQHGYQYPAGMDQVCEEYVKEKWCFVAVKTKVGQKKGVNPRPGQRSVRSKLPEKSVFDGHVQAMGFRFKTETLVVPMRLSAFNEGDTRNIVYLLTEGPKKIRAIPEEYVVRQLPGRLVKNNLTRLLPLRIIGGTEKDIPAYQRKGLKERRDPNSKNGVAKELFAADLLAVKSGELSLEHEEAEKELLRIGEHFGLRGPEIDNENAIALKKEREETVSKGLDQLTRMTLTVVDGDFPREVLANQNLTFASYRMPSRRNNSKSYDANAHGPASKKEGVLKLGAINWEAVEQEKMLGIKETSNSTRQGLSASLILFSLVGVVFVLHRRRRSAFTIAAFAIALAIPVSAYAGSATDEIDDLVVKLQHSSTAKDAIQELVVVAKKDETTRESVIKKLYKVASSSESLDHRGWAIAAMAEIGGQDTDEWLLNIHADEKQEKVVRTWAAAARVSMTRTIAGLVEKAQLVRQFPALGRPIGMRLVEGLKSEENFSVEDVIAVTIKVPNLQQALAKSIMAVGPKELTEVMLAAKDQNVRRQAAGYLGALANQGQSKEVAANVVNELKFDVQAGGVPWEGGPLFVPGISWGKENAKAVAGNLVKWMLWSDINNKDEYKRQIHNNIRSLGLARAAGYTSPGWNDIGITQWLEAWKRAYGNDEIKTILKEQGVLDNDKYNTVLD